jgi:hypothetical protein
MDFAKAEGERAAAHLGELLARHGWTVRRTPKGARATWRWLSVTLFAAEGDDRAHQWTVRLADRWGLIALAEYEGSDPVEGVQAIARHTLALQRPSSQVVGLAPNPSRDYLSFRLWQAVGMGPRAETAYRASH